MIIMNKELNAANSLPPFTHEEQAAVTILKTEKIFPQEEIL